MAYFDNAATTFPKPDMVYSAMDNFYRNHGGSAGRGNYELAETASGLIMETRSLIKDLLHCTAKQVIFEPTATISLNIIIQGLIQKGLKNIYISPFEHNAVTRPLHHYEKSGIITVHQLYVSDNLEYDLERIRYQFDSCKPDIVIVSHASNVIGLIAPIEKIFTLAKKYGAITVADMAQTAGLVDTNVGLEVFDFAVFAGHKTLYGPTGISGFVMKPDFDLPPILFGGTGYDSANQDMPIQLPEKFEMGTLNISGLAGLNAAIKWLKDENLERLRAIDNKNRDHLINLIQNYPFMKIIGNSPKCEYVGIVSCLISGISTDSITPIFSQYDIAIRSGLQCAPLTHKFFKTFPSGTIRFSVGYFSSEDDFGKLKELLDYLSDNF